MKLITLQWNIGGGKIRAINSDSTASKSYNRDGVEYITSLLKGINPDIITLQEVHCNKDVDQVSNIASRLGLGYYVSDFYADSHIEKGQRLGQAIISKYPFLAIPLSYSLIRNIKIYGKMEVSQYPMIKALLVWRWKLIVEKHVLLLLILSHSVVSTLIPHQLKPR